MKKYSFNINQNKDQLTQTLKDLNKEELIQKNSIETESYSVEFNWDEFVVSRKAKMFERSTGIEPDAHIKLVSLSENLTRVDVTIRFSEIAWIILIFVQLGIIAGCLFGVELNWGYRMLLLIGISAAWNLIIWLILAKGANTLREVVTQLFEQLDDKV